MTLLELAERCEAATGPSYVLDLEIAEVIAPTELAWQPPFTASLDAALMLVPEGWTGIVPITGGDDAWLWQERALAGTGHRCRAATPALALCAAALRARHEMEKNA